MSNIDYPFISCKCITYGRVSTLEESIYSFINQKYPGRKELIIINDYPLQKLEFDHPEVKIFNLDYTFSTIGEKENFAIEQCSADIIAVWDDDDLALPNHLCNIAKYFKEDSVLLQWNRGVLFNNPDVAAITGLGNSGIVYSKNAWKEVGGHPLENAGYDMTFIIKLKNTFPSKTIAASPPDDEVSWIYYWGGRSYHMSGLGADNGDDKPNVIVRHSDYIESQRQLGNIPTGIIKLEPKWEFDYTKKVRDYIKKILIISADSRNSNVLEIPKQKGFAVADYIYINDNNFPSRKNSLHPRLKGKIPKMLAWELYPNYDYYIWIDGCFTFTKEDSAKWFVDQLDGHDAAFFQHPHRTTLESELDLVTSGLEGGNSYLIERYEGENIKEQVNSYLKDKNYNSNVLIAAGAFIYSSKIIENKEYNIMKEWFYHNCIWSVQDQLSLPYLLYKFNINYKIINENIFECLYAK